MSNYSFSNALDFGSTPDEDRLLEGVKSGRMPLIDTISQQTFFETNLGKVKKRCNKSEQQKEAIANLHSYLIIWRLCYNHLLS